MDPPSPVVSSPLRTTKSAIVAGVLFALAVALVLLRIRWLHENSKPKEWDQEYLLLGMLVTPLITALCLRVRLIGTLVGASVTAVAWFAFSASFFHYMNHFGSMPAEHCVELSTSASPWECRGHYGFENELLVPHLLVAGLLGTLLGVGAAVVGGRLSANST